MWLHEIIKLQILIRTGLMSKLNSIDIIYASLRESISPFPSITTFFNLQHLRVPPPSSKFPSIKPSFHPFPLAFNSSPLPHQFIHHSCRLSSYSGFLSLLNPSLKAQFPFIPVASTMPSRITTISNSSFSICAIDISQKGLFSLIS